TAPTAFRAIKKEDPRGTHMTKHDLSRFRTLFLAGERCDPDTLVWAREHLGVPVIDHWWQTETGWPIAANCIGLGMLPVKPGSPTKPVPGCEVRVGFVVTKAGVTRSDAEIVRELVERVRAEIGPVAAFKTAIVVKRLPKTRSGKILRGTMKRIADSQEYTLPATIDDPAILGE